ncbi:MAG: hypothetical protein JNK82_22175 [Myxococcaceae bacterium]|nr:hypothetical protein [Myxococcaceae bacterium]
MRALVLCAPLVVISAGCAPKDPGPPTYVRDVQPLIERSCLSCHKEGSIAPVQFDTPEKAKLLSASIWAAIESKRMPPYYASGECNAYKDDPRFTAEETEVIRQWVENGAEVGDLREEKHAEVPQLPTIRRDRVMTIGTDFDVRTMNPNELDNYRCFALDPMATEQLMVTASEVIPGNVQLVHHVLAYEVLASQLGELQALDDRAPGPGYPCKSGSVGIDGTLMRQIAGWVPGSSPYQLPPNSGLHISAGSKIVVQIHYNLNALSRGEVSPFDQTRVAIDVDTSGTLKLARIIPMFNDDLDIPAFEKKSVQTAQFPIGLIYSGARIYGLSGHMHQLGTDVKLEQVKKDGTSKCMVDINDWDFNWQRTYELQRPMTLEVEDSLRITCTYDNSQENQAYIGGVQATPRRVRWGESSFDEMCMVYMTFVQ